VDTKTGVSVTSVLRAAVIIIAICGLRAGPDRTGEFVKRTYASFSGQAGVLCARIPVLAVLKGHAGTMMRSIAVVPQ
jgi:hypothetical protein